MNTNENKQETAEQENTAAEEAAAKDTAEQAAEDTKAPEETAEEKLQKQLDELHIQITKHEEYSAMFGFAAQESMVIPCGMESPFSFPLAEKKTAIHGQKKRR